MYRRCGEAGGPGRLRLVRGRSTAERGWAYAELLPIPKPEDFCRTTRWLPPRPLEIQRGNSTFVLVAWSNPRLFGWSP